MHLVPVVGGKAPVLLRITRGTSVLVKLEEIWLGPNI